jgi:hypothetical protein
MFIIQTNFFQLEVNKMNALEIISLVTAIAVLIKLLVFLVKPKLLESFASDIDKTAKFMTPVILVLFAVIAYYVFSTLSIMQVLPAILLGHIILGLMLVQYPKVYKMFAKEVFKDTSKTWLVWLIWSALSVWVLYVLYF